MNGRKGLLAWWLVVGAVTGAGLEAKAEGEAAPPAEAGGAAPAQPGAMGAEGGQAPAGEAAGGQYNLKLREIEERVNELKEKIFQSKARLIQLQEVVLHGTISGAKAVLVHRNEMGSSFKLARVQYALDGAPIFNRVDTGNGDLENLEEFEVFNGPMAPGSHQISVYLEYQGHGFGIFSYLSGYRFKIKSSYTFTAEEGKMTTVHIVGFEKGGFTTELKDRPSVRYDVEVARELRQATVGEQATGAGDAAKPAAPGPAPTTN